MPTTSRSPTVRAVSLPARTAVRAARSTSGVAVGDLAATARCSRAEWSAARNSFIIAPVLMSTGQARSHMPSPAQVSTARYG